MKDKLVVRVTGQKLYKRKLVMKFVMIAIAILLLFSSAVYGVLYIVNKSGNFTISLDPNLRSSYGIIMSPYGDFRETHITLKAHALEYMDNITESWIPDDIDSGEGDHSKDNYLAYTFYIKNEGKEEIDYIAEIDVQSVIKNVDEAVRVAVYRNGKKTVYAKRQNKSKKPEPYTVPFESNVKVMRQIYKKFGPDDKDRFTIVIWLEGNDPECIDNILGGEIKMLMVIRKYD